MEYALYQRLAMAIQARENCEKQGNNEWFEKHTEYIFQLVEDHMPSGSGIDSGTRILLDQSNSQRLVFETSFHHMSDDGYYDGWTEHLVKVYPSLTNNFELKITGYDRNNIKEYLCETFSEALRQVVTL